MAGDGTDGDGGGISGRRRKKNQKGRLTMTASVGARARDVENRVRELI